MYSKESMERIRQDLQLVGCRFPQFKGYQAKTDVNGGNWTVAQAGQIYLTGKLRTRSRKIYTIVVTFPYNYPFGEIYSYVVDPVIDSTQHRYYDGHLCLYGGHGGNDGQKYEAGRTSALSIIAWVAAWLHAYESWVKTGVWPTIEH